MEDAEKIIREHAAHIHGSLCVFGDWFGRPMDNWHQLISYETKAGYIRLTFNEDETLEIWDPSDLRIEGQSFIIQHASRVRWEWFYYGRPKLPENRFYVEHIVTSQGIEATTNVKWAPGKFEPSKALPAVSIT